jgi:hypothetical protein
MPEPDAGRNDPYLNTDSIRRLLDALRLRLHYAGQAVEEGELEKAEYIVAGVREGCDLIMARLRALRAGHAASPAGD